MIKDIPGGLSKWVERFAWQDMCGIVAGTALAAFGIEGLLVPAHLLTGGVAGLAILLKYSTGIETSIWLLGLNIPIFIAGYRFISRRFILYSLLGTVSLAVFLSLFRICPVETGNPLLAAFWGGALTGSGLGFVFRSKGSSGGTDIVAIIIRRFWGFHVGAVSFAINLVVVALFLAVSDLSTALYSGIAILASSKMVEAVETGLQAAHTAFIISARPEVITEAILHNLHRGCTWIPAIGAYSGQKQTVILVTISRMQLPRLKEIVLSIDGSAFMIVSESTAAYGHGFQHMAEY